MGVEPTTSCFAGNPLSTWVQGLAELCRPTFTGYPRFTVNRTPYEARSHRQESNLRFPGHSQS